MDHNRVQSQYPPHPMLDQDHQARHLGSSSDEQDTNSMEKAAAAALEEDSSAHRMTPNMYLAILALACTYVGKTANITTSHTFVQG